MLGSLRRLLLSPRRFRALRGEVDTEIEAHLDLCARDLVSRGWDPEEARREAQRRFGDLRRARRTLYASASTRDRMLRRGARVEAVIRDFGSGVRRMRNAPAMTVLSVATFALGIGLTTATFAVVDGVLLRPLPFDESDRLMSLQSVDAEGNSFPWVSATNWLDWAEQNRTLESSAIYSTFANVTVATGDDVFRSSATYVSGGFFDVLRLPALVGRTLTEQEVADGEAVAVVSEPFWQRVLAATPDLPTTLVLSGRTTRIVGVVPYGAELPAGTEFWLPASYRRRGGAARNNINWYAVGRLHTESTIADARADLSAIADGIRRADPAGIYSWGVGVRPLQDEITGGSQQTLLLAMGSVLAVLLVACANLAGLEFARSAARSHEMALRVALGASRARLLQQGIIEQTVLAVFGGAIGALLAWWGTAALVQAGTLDTPRAAEIQVDLRVLGFALLVSVSSGLLAGVLPALRAALASPRAAMAGSRGNVGGGGNLPGALLVGGEVAVAAVLLICGGLLLRSFTTLIDRELGFSPVGVVTADISLSSERLRESADLRVAYWSDAMATLRSLPGVTSVSAANPIPTGVGGNGFVGIEQQPDVDASAAFRVVADRYFETLDIPLLLGRRLAPQDGADSEAVVIIDRAMADTYWPGVSPIGQRIRATSWEVSAGAPWRTIVGVVESVRQAGYAGETRRAMYVPYRQAPNHLRTTAILARTSGAPEQLLSAARERLRSLDGELAVDVSTLDARLGNRVSGERFVLSTLGLFAVLALGLAALGIYGLFSFAVGRRTREIAVRVAVGAQAPDILRLVLAGAFKVAGAGMVLGLAVAYAGAGLMASLLVDIAPRDAGTFVAVGGTVLLAALAAAFVPAVRAARQSPLTALRRG